LFPRRQAAGLIYIYRAAGGFPGGGVIGKCTQLLIPRLSSILQAMSKAAAPHRLFLAIRIALMLFVATPVLVGCAIKPEQVSSQSSSQLCRLYGAMLHPNYLDPDIRRELVRRGDAACTDPALIQARNNANLQGIKLGSQIMKQSRPQALPPGAYRATTPQKNICMYNPATRGMATCYHFTAGGQCAHYGSPCIP